MRSTEGKEDSDGGGREEGEEGESQCSHCLGAVACSDSSSCRDPRVLPIFF